MDKSYLNIESIRNHPQETDYKAGSTSLSPVKDPKAVTFMVVGIVTALGGIFLLLATFNVLPHGVNTISQLGLGGKVLGGVVIGLGFSSTVYGSVRWCRSNKESPISEVAHEEKIVTPTKEIGQPLTRPGTLITESHFVGFLQYRSLENKKYSHATSVTFFYCKCDGFDDYGWGCAWRSIQTCASALNLFPTFDELYQTYRMDERSADEWAEPGYGMRYFDNVGAPSSQLVLYKRDEGTKKTPTKFCDKVSNFSDLREMMVQHFETQGTPIMADDEKYAYNIIGIRVTATDETILFIADPHKLNAISGLYYVALDSDGRQIATTGIDNGKNGYSSVQRLHFHTSWMFLFPRKKISQNQGSLNLPEMGEESSPFTRLSTEVMIHIFQFLQPQELCAVSRVCKQWNNLSKQNIIWKEHFLMDFASVKMDEKSAIIDYKSEYKKQKLKKLSNNFNSLIRSYYDAVRITVGCGSRGQLHIDDAWDKIDSFALLHPEFRSQVPKKAVQYDDGRGGTGSGFSNFGW